MSHSVLTPWFDGEKFKPVRKGIYQLMSGENIGYQHWNGMKWGPWAESAISTTKNPAGLYAHWTAQNDNWRGVLKLTVE